MSEILSSNGAVRAMEPEMTMTDASVNDLAHASVNDDAAGGSNAGSSESGMVSLLRGGDAARSNEAAGGCGRRGEHAGG